MSTSNDKVNDLSQSALRKRFFSHKFVPENNHAVICVRVSGEKQESGGSFGEQEEATGSYTKSEKLNVVETYRFCETASKHEKRKHWQEMLAEIRSSQGSAKPVKHVVFSHQSRSNRNRYSARDLEDLIDLGVTIHFARDRRKLHSKADVSQWMMWHMENMKNAAYIDELTKNAMGGHIKCLERGISPQGVPPFGFKSEGRQERRRWVFDGKAASYMQRAFELIIERESDISLGRYSDEMLKADLDVSFSHLKKTPGKKQFCHLLRNPTYYGDIPYGGVVYRGDPQYHPPLISKGDWLKVQDILSGRHGKRRISKAHAYIGLMKCRGKILDDDGGLTDQNCGYAITAERIRKTYKDHSKHFFDYYRCSRPSDQGSCSQRDRKFMREVVGRNVSYRDQEIEVIFRDIFRSFSLDEVTCQRMKQYLWKEHFEQKKNDHGNRDRLQQREKELLSFIEKSYEDKLTGAISEDLWRKNNQKWQREKEEVIAELRSLNDTKDEYMQRGVTLIELMQHAEIIFKNATPDKKRKMVELVSSNLLLADGTLQYDWKLPFNMLAVRGDLEKWLGN